MRVVNREHQSFDYIPLERKDSFPGSFHVNNICVFRIVIYFAGFLKYIHIYTYIEVNSKELTNNECSCSMKV